MPRVEKLASRIVLNFLLIDFLLQVIKVCWQGDENNENWPIIFDISVGNVLTNMQANSPEF
ncbi:hypothetical protein HW44_03050 [Nitrosococcus oceani]|nr:hypothetical protein HW44_03050 [Nitrosococcus oceani]